MFLIVLSLVAFSASDEDTITFDGYASASALAADLHIPGTYFGSGLIKPEDSDKLEAVIGFRRNRKLVIANITDAPCVGGLIDGCLDGYTIQAATVTSPARSSHSVGPRWQAIGDNLVGHEDWALTTTQVFSTDAFGDFGRTNEIDAILDQAEFALFMNDAAAGLQFSMDLGDQLRLGAGPLVILGIPAAEAGWAAGGVLVGLALDKGYDYIMEDEPYPVPGGVEEGQEIDDDELDSDGDGVPNGLDGDDDGDGVPDEDDAHPFDPGQDLYEPYDDEFDEFMAAVLAP